MILSRISALVYSRVRNTVNVVLIYRAISHCVDAERRSSSRFWTVIARFRPRNSYLSRCMLNEKIWNSQWVDQFCVPEDLDMIVVSFHDGRATGVALSRGEFYEERRAQIRSFLLYRSYILASLSWGFGFLEKMWRTLCWRRLYVIVNEKERLSRIIEERWRLIKIRMTEVRFKSFYFQSFYAHVTINCVTILFLVDRKGMILLPLSLSLSLSLNAHCAIHSILRFHGYSFSALPLLFVAI